TVWTAAETAAVAEAAHRAGAVVHLDGARIFNAAVALGVPAAELAAPVDSVTFCLSKGLSAPVGSIVAGSRAFIARARRARQILGGTLRQAGVLAAAGLVALAHYERLREDHATARALAEGLAAIPGVRIDLEAVQTNIVYADVRGTGRPAQALVEALAAERVRALAVGADRIRFVTHRHVEPGDIGPTLAAVRRAVTGAAA
ncbi:MAG TPA: beta-eliminating lyase-related protein, partial [Limnochordia bacterium]